MANADVAIEHTLELEGGYSNHAADPGGETMYGISKVHWPRYWMEGTPTIETAKRFYRVEFWDKLKCQDLNSQFVANELFDTAVNMGHSRAVKFLQSAYNRLRPDNKPELKVDGRIGALTIAAVNDMTRNHALALFNYMNYLQAAEYDRIGNTAFLRGWFGNRIKWKWRED